MNSTKPLFAGTKSLEAWKVYQVILRQEDFHKKQEEFLLSRKLVVSPEAIACVDHNTGQITIVDHSGMRTMEGRDYSFAEHHSALIQPDGSVKCLGEDEFGQCNTGDIRDAIAVLADARSTWVVHQDGSISARGAIDYPDALNWKEILRLYRGDECLIGLKRDGTLVWSNGTGFGNHALFETMQKWTNITELYTAKGAVLGVTTDRQILFAGLEDDPRKEAEKWQNCIAVNIDSGYAVGLTRDGTILLAGNRPAFLDQGRKNAAAWESIIGIACGDASIVGVQENGTICAVGNIKSIQGKIS